MGFRKHTDYTGQTFSRLTALYFYGHNKHGDILWKFKCSCGTECSKVIGCVKDGRVRSCGCYNREVQKSRTFPTNYETFKARREANPAIRMWQAIRARTRDAMRGHKKPESLTKALGCKSGDFRAYIESKFQPGMTWENYGYYGWHIDHIKPLSRFNLLDPIQYAEACHYTNLQPLWALDNIKKGNKML